MIEPWKLLTVAQLAALPANRTTAPNTWGTVTLDASTYVLVIDDDYEVDLERCTTPAAVLDWVAQIAGKNWATPATIGHLVNALDDVLHLQANLCPFGMCRRPGATLTPAAIRQRVDMFTARSKP